MKKVMMMILALFAIVGCEISNGEIDEPTRLDTQMPEETFEAPAVYKYYVDPSKTLDENIEMSLTKANLTANGVAPIVVDEPYNTVVFVDVKSPVQAIGKLSFDLDQLDTVDYDVDAYIASYRDEGVTLAKAVEDELLILLCNESEGIPTTAIWYESQVNDFTAIVLAYQDAQQSEGLIHDGK